MPGPLSSAACERSRDLRAAAVVGAAEAGAGGVRHEAAVAVGDDHAASEVVCRGVQQLLQLARAPEPAGGAVGDELCRGVRLPLHLGIHAPRQIQRQRQLERNDREHEHVGERSKQANAEAHAGCAPPCSSALANLKPTPRTVCR